MQWRVQNLKLHMVGDELKLEARVYRSQGKKEKPHLMVIMFVDNNIQDQHCLCIAGEDSIHLPSIHELTKLETNVNSFF